MGQMCGKCSDALWRCGSAVGGICEGEMWRCRG